MDEREEKQTPAPLTSLTSLSNANAASIKDEMEDKELVRHIIAEVNRHLQEMDKSEENS